jgi:hypothetical protein
MLFSLLLGQSQLLVFLLHLADLVIVLLLLGRFFLNLNISHPFL